MSQCLFHIDLVGQLKFSIDQKIPVKSPNDHQINVSGLGMYFSSMCDHGTCNLLVKISHVL